jgi:WD40 repeat protein
LDATRGLSIGPPEPLPLPNGSDLAQSRDGRIIATCDRNVSTQIPYAGGWILHTDRPKEPIRVDAGADIADIAVSPDGRWVVTSTHVVGLAKIWDARDGRLVKQLANWGANSPRFSPDSHWLATNLRGGCLVDVNTWEPRQRLGPRCGFAPDSRLAAVPTANGLRLTDAASGREVAMLEDPNLDSIVQVVFTPDGTKLIALSFMKGLHVWDLRLIRRQLKDLGLDWDWPEFPPTVAASRQDDVPTKLKIRLGDKWVSEAPDKSQAKPKP